MIISTCGFGSTGSSAVSDYLRECNDIEVLDGIEFDISTIPDGIEDLEYHCVLRHSRINSSVYAIQRFRKLINNYSKTWCRETSLKHKDLMKLTEDYLSAISQLSFVGYSPSYDKKGDSFFRRYVGYSLMLQRLMPYAEKKHLIKGNKDFYPLESIQVSIDSPNFYEESRRFIRSLLTLMGCDESKKIVLDQAFVGDDPVKSFPFFDDPYAIVVDRDPRDLYIFAKKFLRSQGRFMPSDDVMNFIKYYRLLRERRPYTNTNERVLCIRFEEMVYDYDNTADKIDSFLNVENKHRQTIFQPAMSAANTNLIKRFPDLEPDIEVIERELQDYLFDFNHYDSVDNTGEMFFGRSLLNK